MAGLKITIAGLKQHLLETEGLSGLSIPGATYS